MLYDHMNCLTCFTYSGYNINDLFKEAQTRWLKPAEVLFILQNHEKYKVTPEPPQQPVSKFPFCSSCFFFSIELGRHRFIDIPIEFVLTIDWILQQVDLYFFLTRGSFGFSVEMDTVGVRRGMEGLLVKHMNDLRFVKVVH